MRRRARQPRRSSRSSRERRKATNPDPSIGPPRCSRGTRPSIWPDPDAPHYFRARRALKNKSVTTNLLRLNPGPQMIRGGEGASGATLLALGGCFRREEETAYAIL